MKWQVDSSDAGLLFWNNYCNGLEFIESPYIYITNSASYSTGVHFAWISVDLMNMPVLLVLLNQVI